MAFKKTSELGHKDPRIAPGGRRMRWDLEDGPPKTYRELGKDELLKLFRKIKPLSKDAIQVAHGLMMKESVGEATRLKAAAMIVQEYRNLVKEIYDQDDLLDPNDEAANTEPATVFSLKVVGGTTDKAQE